MILINREPSAFYKPSAYSSQATAKTGALNSSSGFTLIEMLVVVAIIVLITMVAMPTVSSYFQVSLTTATRDMATIINEAYNSALASGQVHRLVYDLKENTYWVESGPADYLIDTKESKEKADRRKRFQSPNDKPPPPAFRMETTVTRKKIKLPTGVVFEDVVTQQSPDPITEGNAYTHFFPQGLTEQTIVHLTDSSQHHVSLVPTPLIGKTNLYDKYVKREEVFAK